jgi:methylated-DNA-protein-cysteine methyltransferase-like protein
MAPGDRAEGRFRQRVLAAVRRIPPGKVATYGDVAAAAGAPRAARAVGNIMKGCRIPGVPCHRVIAAGGRMPGGPRPRVSAAGGRLGGYGGSEGLKRALLAAEGITVSGTRVREFDRKRFIYRR